MINKSIWLTAIILLTCSSQSLAGASCVVVKKLGNSLAIEWVAGEDESATSAIEKAKIKLLKQGWHGKYQDYHPQANTNLTHAYVVIVKTDYQTVLDKPRTSYGCGFSSISQAAASQAALIDLRNYSWGWKPEYGYQIVKTFSY